MVVLNSLVNNDSSSWDPLHLSDSDVILKPKLMPCLMLTTDSLGHYRQVVVMMYGQSLAESTGQQTPTETPPPSWGGKQP